MPGHVVKSTGPDPDPTEFLFISAEQRMLDQTKPYDPKKSCWVPDDKEGFLEGLIQGAKGDKLVSVQLKSGEVKDYKTESVVQVNASKYEKCEDVSNLTFLNDASVLYNLKSRCQAKLIYTYSDLFCIAINPYKRFPIYTNRTVKIYQGKRRNEVPPHLFAISDGAYMDMLQSSVNQSMLITGESGAGKTENTKKVLSYFANVGATTKKKEDENKPNLEDQIVQTNPPLEAYGNAKTTRNDNSSRFGKFIRIHFAPNGKLSGADIEVYLLEKARVVSQAPAERGYHIFYQMMTDRVPYIKKICKLSNDIYDYHYEAQGKVTVPTIDDNEDMEFTHNAFTILNFTDEERDSCYKITAAVMHMGNMKFKQRGREEQAEPDGTEAGEILGELLATDSEELYRNLCKPKIKVGAEFVTQGRNVAQVYYSVSALAKGVFDRLFKWIVKKCNQTLETGMKRAMFIGVLDIAGFEIFDFNGFEQICINFCNEKLQQFFNHHMFVLEQEEYKAEGIDWVFVDFGMDLQACIELFEKKLGLLAILEEESMFPKATDKTFEEKLKANHLGKSPCFIKPKPPKPGQSEGHFAIVHYAGTVTYNLSGWLEKNKDPLNDTVVDQLKKSKMDLVVELFADHPGQSAPAEAKGGMNLGIL
nr:myosin heavy chain, muscle-like [Penaeus vannamei]